MLMNKSGHTGGWHASRRTPWLLAVAGLHALLFIAWPRQPVVLREASGSPREPAVLRLLWPTQPTPPAQPGHAREASPRTAPARMPKPTPKRDALAPPAALQRPTAPVTAPPSAAQPPLGQAITLPPADPPASAPRRAEAPLDLRWPPRNLQPAETPAAAAALADPRAHSARPNWEARIARSLDQHVLQELQPDGSVRIRQGDHCLVAKATRGSQLDPFSEHAKTAPRAIGSCH